MTAAKPPRFRITLELEPVETWVHADARHAAQRVADAIEQVKFGSPSSAAPHVVKITTMTVEELLVCDDQRTEH
jgi:hypothetical protein